MTKYNSTLTKDLIQSYLKTRHPHYLLNSTAYLNVYSLTTKSLNHFTTHVETFTHVHPNYMASKIHKVNCPIRPIVSLYHTPLIALHKTLAYYLKPLSNSNLRLKDSNDMIQILRSITNTSSHSYFCWLDIKSLYISCNMKHAQRIVKSKLQDYPSLLPSDISSTAFDTLISFCLDNSYLEYNKFFAQNTGGPMGLPLTVVRGLTQEAPKFELPS